VRLSEIGYMVNGHPKSSNPSLRRSADAGGIGHAHGVLSLVVALMAVTILSMFFCLFLVVQQLRAIEAGRVESGEPTKHRPSPSESYHVFRIFHLDNAVLNGRDRGVGIRIEEQQKRELAALREALAACSADDGALLVQVRGYASSAPFMVDSVIADNSDEMNLQVANERAEAIVQILKADKSSLNVESAPWKTFSEMVDARSFNDHEGDGRSSMREFLNRRVEIVVPDIGECVAQRWSGDGEAEALSRVMPPVAGAAGPDPGNRGGRPTRPAL
jgi:hypothetical protein